MHRAPGCILWFSWCFPVLTFLGLSSLCLLASIGMKAVLNSLSFTCSRYRFPCTPPSPSFDSLFAFVSFFPFSCCVGINCTLARAFHAFLPFVLAPFPLPVFGAFNFISSFSAILPLLDCSLVFITFLEGRPVSLTYLRFASASTLYMDLLEDVGSFLLGSFHHSEAEAV